MTDFSPTSDVKIGNTEQIDDNNTSTSDGGQIIESDDDTRETSLEQNGDIELLQHLAVVDDFVRIVRGDAVRSIQDVPDSPIDLHASSNSKFVFYTIIIRVYERGLSRNICARPGEPRRGSESHSLNGSIAVANDVLY